MGHHQAPCSSCESPRMSCSVQIASQCVQCHWPRKGRLQECDLQRSDSVPETNSAVLRFNRVITCTLKSWEATCCLSRPFHACSSIITIIAFTSAFHFADLSSFDGLNFLPTLYINKSCNRTLQRNLRNPYRPAPSRRDSLYASPLGQRNIEYPGFITFCNFTLGPKAIPPLFKTILQVHFRLNRTHKDTTRTNSFRNPSRTSSVSIPIGSSHWRA